MVSVVWMVFMSVSFANTEVTPTATEVEPNFAIKEKFKLYLTVELVMAFLIAFNMGTFTIPFALISIWHDVSLLLKYLDFVNDPANSGLVRSLWISIILHILWFATVDIGIWWALDITSELFQRGLKGLFFLALLAEFAYLTMMYNMTIEFKSNWVFIDLP